MAETNTKSCFVVMGFGKKMDFETNRLLDLDKSYRNIIKPAVEAAGLSCVRADEIVHTGLIDVPMYEQLLQADVVIADLSTSNKNAFYELGIRHALRPCSTIIIAEDGIKAFPFDINHIAVRQYRHMGEDIGFDEVMRFRTMLTDTIRTIVAKPLEEVNDSPVYTFLNDLRPPERRKDPQSAPAVQPDLPQETAQPSHRMLMDQVDDAQLRGDWLTAKTLLAAIRRMAADTAERQRAGASVEPATASKEDPYLLQRLALATYKSKFPDEQAALLEARDLLQLLRPDTSNDMETLGLWASVHKRLWQLGPRPEYLDEAIRGAERGFLIANDYYNGINYAYLLNARAADATDPDEAAADRVAAKRVRKKVLELCGRWLLENPEPLPTASAQAKKEYRARWYWVMATKGEAAVGLGDGATAEPVLRDAYENAPEPWMRVSTEEQLKKLRQLLA